MPKTVLSELKLNTVFVSLHPNVCGMGCYLQILSSQATALDGAEVTPTVLQCTTVRQEGRAPT